MKTKSAIAALLLVVPSCQRAVDADAGSEDPLLYLDNERVRTNCGEFGISDTRLSQWLTETRKRAGGEHASLKLEIGGDTFWVRIAHVVALAHSSGWSRIAILHDTATGSSAPDKSEKPSALIVLLAGEAGEGTITVSLPEVLPWKASFQKVQTAAYSRRPVFFEVLRASRQMPTIPEK